MMGPSDIHCEDDLLHSNLPSAARDRWPYLLAGVKLHCRTKLLKSETGLPKSINAPTSADRADGPWQPCKASALYGPNFSPN
jgi:hypothetical protein